MPENRLLLIEKIRQILSDDSKLQELIQRANVDEIEEMIGVGYTVPEVENLICEILANTINDVDIFFNYLKLFNSRRPEIVNKYLAQIGRGNPTLAIEILEKSWNSTLSLNNKGNLLAECYKDNPEKILEIAVDPLRRQEAFFAIWINGEVFGDRFNQKIIELMRKTAPATSKYLLPFLVKHLGNQDIFEFIVEEIGKDRGYDSMAISILPKIGDVNQKKEVLSKLIAKGDENFVDEYLYNLEVFSRENRAYAIDVLYHLVASRDYLSYWSNQVLPEFGKTGSKEEVETIIQASKYNPLRNTAYGLPNVISNFILGDTSRYVDYLDNSVKNQKHKLFYLQVISHLAKEYYRERENRDLSVLEGLITIVEKQAIIDGLTLKPRSEFNDQYGVHKYIKYILDKYFLGKIDVNEVNTNGKKYQTISKLLLPEIVSNWDSQKQEENAISVSLSKNDGDQIVPWLNFLDKRLAEMTQTELSQFVKKLTHPSQAMHTFSEIVVMYALRKFGLKYDVIKESKTKVPEGEVFLPEKVSIEVTCPELYRDLEFGGSASLHQFRGIDKVKEKTEKAKIRAEPFIVVVDASYSDVHAHSIDNGFNGTLKFMMEKKGDILVDVGEFRDINERDKAPNLDHITAAITLRYKIFENTIQLESDYIQNNFAIQAKKIEWPSVKKLQRALNRTISW